MSKINTDSHPYKVDVIITFVFTVLVFHLPVHAYAQG